MARLLTMTLQGSILPLRLSRVLLAVCWVTVISGTAHAVTNAGSRPGVVAWASTAVFLVAFTIVVERPGVERLLVVCAVAAVAMQYAAPNNGALIAVVGVISVAGIRLDGRSSRALAGAAGIGFLVASAQSAHPLQSSEIVSIVPALGFTYVASTALRRLRAEQRRAEDLLEEVVAGRDARIRAAAMDERTRLAREMHDVLAHTLSALSIQLEGTRMLAEQRSSDPAVTAALERASGLAREGLTEARRAVASLRGEALPGPDLLPQLVQDFERDTGVPSHLQIEGRSVELSAEARLALYRIAQEALTNVRKHAEAFGVAVTLRYGEEGVELIVENEGVPRQSPVPGGGYGLSGMRERAELLGGRLEAGPTERGFKVCLWLPRRSGSLSAS